MVLEKTHESSLDCKDIDRIVAMLPAERQTLLFSATMSPAIRGLVESVAQDPQEISIERPQLTVPTCEQMVYEVVFSSRIEVLSRLIEMGRMKRGLVFANTKRVVDDIVDGLLARGYAVDRLHGDMPQNLRERVMDSFRKGNLNVLAATDIAARGLDIDDVDTVVNFELPRDPEDYVRTPHRPHRPRRPQGQGGILHRPPRFLTPRPSGALCGCTHAARKGHDRCPGGGSAPRIPGG